MDFEWPREDDEEYWRIVAETARWPVESDGSLFRELWSRCAGLGLVGLSVPVSFGGGGHGFLRTARRVEAFGRGCPDMGLVFAGMAHLFACAMPIAEHGRDLRQWMLPRLCSGEWIGANAITEDGAGSDVTALVTRARRDGDTYRIDGMKSFVSNGPVADVFLIYARTDPALGHLGLSAFAVERTAPGLTVGEPFDKVGLASCQAGTITLDGCRVAADHRLGREGEGAAIFQQSMRWERTCLFAAYLGQMERLIERCVQHARQRRQFGRPIGANQAVSHRIAGMQLQLEAARLLLWRACWRLDRGERAVLDIAMAKLAISEGAVDTALAAMQVFGGHGVQVDSGIERELRDALPSRIFSGTSEMQREQIAGEIGL